VAHRGLGRAKRNTRAAEVGAEGVAQRVDVDRPTTLVGLYDDLLAVPLLDPRNAGE